MAQHIWKRGNQYWLRLTIPADLQRYFPSRRGKPQVRIAEHLSDSASAAKLKAAQRVAVYSALFARLKAGEKMTPAEIEATRRGPSYDPEDLEDPSHPLNINNPAYQKELAEHARRQRERYRLLVEAAKFEVYGMPFPIPGAIEPEPAAPAPTSGETISQAAEAWYPEIERTKPRASTLKGLRDHVRTFIAKCGDMPLTAVDRATASDFLRGLNVSTSTRNTYALTLKRVFKCAARRGRFSKLEEDNPFHDQRLKVTKGERVPRDRFTIEELQTLFDALPRDVNPKKHTPETAVPWVALIAAYSGACLEEICQLTVDDIREETVNGGTLVCIDIHNGDDGHKLKNEEARPRLLPMHSTLVRLGLLDYIANLPKHGQLFPGLTRRASKDNKIGPRVGELFNKKRRTLGITRKGMKLDFHSFRHTVSNTLEIAGVSQTDAARVLGHTIEGMSYGNYSLGGPGLKRVAGIVEQITYEGLRL
jgi:integrase